MKSSQSTLAISLLFAFLGGCSTYSPSGSNCIKTALVSSLSKVSLHSVLKDDPRVVTISTFMADCGGAKTALPGGEGDIGINMVLTMPKAKRPNGKSQRVSFPVFVALLDDDENVIDRHDENINVIINHNALIHTHKITYHPPKEIEVGSKDHHILVGFRGDVMAAHSGHPRSQGKKTTH